MKYVILHVIETLDRGGAEVMFINYINSLPPIFKNIVVFLREPATLEVELSNAAFVQCLGYKRKLDYPRIGIKLSRIIKKYQVNLIHSHLYWPTIVSRFANMERLPHIFSVHTIMTHDAFMPNRLSRYLEMLTYCGHQTALFVSEAAQSDYQSHIKVTGKAAVLYNFVRDEYFDPSAHKIQFQKNGLKLVTVGNLRPQKGHVFLIKCLRNISCYNISLDIYGEGQQRGELEEYIKANRVANVRLMGSHPQPEAILKKYDAFILGTQYEGFCLAMAEAMAVGLPCIVPATEALKEISGGEQLYFSLNNNEECKERIMELYQQADQVKRYARLATERAIHFTKAVHIKQLVEVYEEELKTAK